jgi:D-glycero-alpha-D-manno-heptose-7-phosphate kinase
MVDLNAHEAGNGGKSQGKPKVHCGLLYSAGTETGDSKTMDSLHRTLELGYSIRQALEKGDLECFGRMLHEHWENKKLRSEKIADARRDNWHELARRNGMLGGKIMGAGGGGFFMFYCPPEKKSKVREVLQQSGLREMSYEFDFDGAKVIANF